MLPGLRIKLAIIGILLFLALSTTVFAAQSTYQAIQHLQQQSTLVKQGDVRSIRPWMTIPYISRMYHVPENFLYNWLHIPDKATQRKMTLHALAQFYKRPESELIAQAQQAIEAYRQQHPDKQCNPSCHPAHHNGTAQAPILVAMAVFAIDRSFA